MNMHMELAERQSLISNAYCRQDLWWPVLDCVMNQHIGTERWRWRSKVCLTCRRLYSVECKRALDGTVLDVYIRGLTLLHRGHGMQLH